MKAATGTAGPSVMRRRAWRFAGSCVLLGLAFGIGTVFTLMHRSEPVVAPVALVLVGFAAAVVSPRSPKRVAWVGGFAMALTAVWIQGLLLDVYLANHPEYRDVPIPFGLSARTWTLTMAPVGASVAGLVSLGAAAVAAAILGKRGDRG